MFVAGSESSISTLQLKFKRALKQVAVSILQVLVSQRASMSMYKATHHSNRSLNFVIVHIGPHALDHQFSLALLAVHTLQIWPVFVTDCDSSEVLQT